MEVDSSIITNMQIAGEMHDPVLSFELDNGFRFIKILANYLEDVRSMNYASFIEWINPQHSACITSLRNQGNHFWLD